MPEVISPDGTPIAYHRRGIGPPLILVHGTGAANALAWTAVLPALEEHFTVLAVDRRGRGESGDRPGYAIEREFEDVAAVVDATGEPAAVLGHSFGGICALEAALLTPNVHRLVLYELTIPLPGMSITPAGLIERLQALLEMGDQEGAWVTFMQEVAGLTPDEIARFRSSPPWPERMASAHTLLREMRAQEDYRFDTRRFENLNIPVLHLLGGDSPDIEQVTTWALHRALPNSRVAVMPGQQHVAMYTAPDLLAREVLTFLTRSEEGSYG